MALVEKISKINSNTSFAKKLNVALDSTIPNLVSPVNNNRHITIDLNKYIVPEPRFDINSNQSNLNSLYQRFVYTLQNRTGMAGVRKHTQVDYHHKTDNIASVLYNFDPHAVAQNFLTVADLFAEFQNQIPTLRTYLLRTQGNDPWRVFCSGILSGAKFFATFTDKAQLKEFFDRFLPLPSWPTQTQYYMLSALPAMLSTHIAGLGFTLACDFIKEIGYASPKPDVHIMDVIQKLYQKPNLTEIQVVKILIDIANILNISVYKLDKLIWLICTGKFYLDDAKATSMKSILLNLL